MLVADLTILVDPRLLVSELVVDHRDGRVISREPQVWAPMSGTMLFRTKVRGFSPMDSR